MAVMVGGELAGIPVHHAGFDGLVNPLALARVGDADAAGRAHVDSRRIARHDDLGVFSAGQPYHDDPRYAVLDTGPDCRRGVSLPTALVYVACRGGGSIGVLLCEPQLGALCG